MRSVLANQRRGAARTCRASGVRSQLNQVAKRFDHFVSACGRIAAGRHATEEAVTESGLEDFPGQTIPGQAGEPRVTAESSETSKRRARLNRRATY